MPINICFANCPISTFSSKIAQIPKKSVKHNVKPPCSPCKYFFSFGACLGYFLSSLDWTWCADLMGTDAQSAAMAAVLVVLSASLLVTMAVVDENSAVARQRRAGSDADVGDSEVPLKNRGNSLKNRGKSLTEEATSILEYLEQVVTSVLSAPVVLRRLFVADLLSWMAIMAHQMYW